MASTMSLEPEARSRVPTASRVRRPAFERLPLLALGFAALAIGVGAGLARLGWPMPAVAASAAAWHGPLMVGGFFGVVIALERAVALGRPWAYAAPALAGAATVATLAGAPGLAAAALLASSLVLLVATLLVLRVQRESFVVVLALGAGSWCVGNALWLAGRPVAGLVPWWIAFLVLTIAGERLELSRLRPRAAGASRSFAVIVAVLLVAAGLTSWTVPPVAAFGAALFGGGLLGLAAWLWRHDLARHTVRQRGLTRYIAVCLLAGYGWLAVGGATIAVFGLAPGHAAYDAALHALLLGFVFSMVFGHAPIVFPSVLRVAVPYRPAFYGPLVLLHASVAWRLAGDALSHPTALRAGAMLSAVALAAFVVTLVATVATARRRLAATAAVAP
jgi:hypothetical protein